MHITTEDKMKDADIFMYWKLCIMGNFPIL